MKHRLCTDAERFLALRGDPLPGRAWMLAAYADWRSVDPFPHDSLVNQRSRFCRFVVALQDAERCAHFPPMGHPYAAVDEMAGRVEG